MCYCYVQIVSNDGQEHLSDGHCTNVHKLVEKDRILCCQFGSLKNKIIAKV